MIITDHAEKRLNTRGITKRRLEKVLRTAPRRARRKGALTVNGNDLTIVIDGGIVITAYRQNKRQWRKSLNLK